MANEKVWVLDRTNKIFEVKPTGPITDPELLAGELATTYTNVIYFMDEAATAEDLMSDFKSELRVLLNKHNMPGRCQMQDFVLASLLSNIVIELENAGRKERASGRV